MVKLYVLGIIFYVCALVISDSHIRELGELLKIEKSSKKKRIESWMKIIAMGLMPVVNVVVGIILLMVAIGLFDELIKREFNKDSLN